jgi:hypothetical protein
LRIVQERAAQLKNASDAPEVLAWRYALRKNEVEEWLQQTEWASTTNLDQEVLKKTVETLLDLGLISHQEAAGWPEKLLG